MSSFKKAPLKPPQPPPVVTCERHGWARTDAACISCLNEAKEAREREENRREAAELLKPVTSLLEQLLAEQKKANQYLAYILAAQRPAEAVPARTVSQTRQRIAQNAADIQNTLQPGDVLSDEELVWEGIDRFLRYKPDDFRLGLEGSCKERVLFALGQLAPGTLAEISKHREAIISDHKAMGHTRAPAWSLDTEAVIRFLELRYPDCG